MCVLAKIKRGNGEKKRKKEGMENERLYVVQQPNSNTFLLFKTNSL